MSRDTRIPFALPAVALALSAALAAPAQAAALKFTALTTTFTNEVGIDYYEPGNKLITSVNYPNGAPYNFELVAADGSHAQFSNLSGFTDEVKIATARSVARGGYNYGANPAFAPGTMFTGNGVDGQVVRINPDGTINTTYTLGGAETNGLMRGSMYVDRAGVVGGDLVAATTAGEVWRISPTGATSKIADLNGVHLEGLMTVPNDPGRYGGLAGKIIAGAEGLGRLYTFDLDGTVSFYNVGVNIEDIDLIMGNENFFGVNFGTGRILGVEAAQWAPFTGDILLTQELRNPGDSGLYRLTWDFANNRPTAEAFLIAPGSSPVGQWEHVTFAPAGVREISATIPEPSSLLLGLAGIAGLLRSRRRA